MKKKNLGIKLRQNIHECDLTIDEKSIKIYIQISQNQKKKKNFKTMKNEKKIKKKTKKCDLTINEKSQEINKN